MYGIKNAWLFHDWNKYKETLDWRFHNKFLNQTYNFIEKWEINMVPIISWQL